MPVIPFKISGEFITRHARNLATEGTGDGALKFLMESFDNLPYPTAIGILTGDVKLVGVNDLKEEPDNDQDHKALVRFQYGGIFRNGIHQRAYQPYAIVTGWGPDDAHYACRQTHAAAPTIFSPHKKQWYTYRSRFYCDDSNTDLVVDGLLLPLSKDYVTVLFAEIRNVPIWVQTHRDPQDALNEYLQDNTLEERGAHRMRNEDAPVMARYRELAKQKDAITETVEEAGFDPARLPPELVAAVAETTTPEALQSLLTPREGDPPVVAGDIGQRNGWVTLDGTYYTCLYNEHVALARVLWLHLGNPEVEDYEQAAENAGWAKVRSGGFIGQQPTIELVNHQPTDEQRNTISLWCRRHGEKFREVVKIHSRGADHAEEGEGVSGQLGAGDHARDSENQEGDRRTAADDPNQTGEA